MFGAKFKAASAAGIVIFLLLCSCGEMNSLFPSNRTYEVSAMTDKVSLDEFALVREDDEIRPFFVHSIIGDTDIRFLRVFVQNAVGNQTGETVLYHFQNDEDAHINEVESTEAGADESAEGSVDQLAEDFLDARAKLIPVKRMNDEFPVFSLPENLEPGAYTMVFQVLGDEKKIISRTEKSFYYMAGTDYHITEIRASLPGMSSTPHLFQPGTTVLLETQMEADEGLDPYIVWYNGRNRIHSGRFLDGAGRFLWKIPESTSFLNLRVEVIPFLPLHHGTADGSKLRGKTRTISLAVSAKAQFPETFAQLIEAREAENPGSKMRFYRFEGNLLDSFNTRKEQALMPLNPEEPESDNSLWLSSGYIYGLAAGPGDRYSVPGFDIKGEEKTLNSFEAILNFMPLSPGVIFEAVFSDKQLELVWDGEDICLYLETKYQKKQILASIPGENNTENRFIKLSVLFTVSEKELKIIIGDNEIILNHSIGDKGNVLIGGDSFAAAAEPEAANPEQEAVEDPLQPVMILDELVLIRYPGIPIEEIAMEEETTEPVLPL